MKIYGKILLIAAAIQILGFSLARIIDQILLGRETVTIAPLFAGLAAVAASMGISLMLALKWCESRKKAILTFLLLPTNYTFLILGLLLFRFVSEIISIMENLPPNFG